jgi:hypothetical protein
MTYQEALSKALTVKWKVGTCSQGEKCWCRTVQPLEDIEDSDGNVIFIVSDGSITKEHAEYLVKLQNEKIENDGKFSSKNCSN